MVKWTRVKLALSVITAAGLWQTLRERVAIGYRAGGAPARADCGCRDAGHALIDIAGALHVHSNYSDGIGTVDEIAQAAAQAGIDFVLLTDHSSLEAIANGQSRWYAGKALIVVGTEITTDLGHILALRVPPSMPVTPAPTDAVRAAIEANHGFGVVALPCDLKDHWRDYSRFPPGFGLEVFNLSSIARTKINIPGLLLTIARYVSRRKHTAYHYIASRPVEEIRLWDKLCLEAHRSGRRIPVCIGSLDAHGVMKVARRRYPIPSYRDVFRVLTTHLLLKTPLERSADDPSADIAAINDAIEGGSSYVSYDIYGDPRGFGFQISGAQTCAGMGSTLTIGRRGQCTVRIDAPSPKCVITLMRNGRAIARQRGAALERSIKRPGVYRAEVSTYKNNLGPICLGVHPWIFSNPIEVRTQPANSSGL